MERSFIERVDLPNGKKENIEECLKQAFHYFQNNIIEGKEDFFRSLKREQKIACKKLADISRAPNESDLEEHIEKLGGFTNVVNKMIEHGKITAAEYQATDYWNYMSVGDTMKALWEEKTEGQEIV